MNYAPTTCLEHLPPELVKRLEDDCNQFVASWKEGPPPRIEDYLREVLESERPIWFRHLLDLELQHRRNRNDWPTKDEYLDRYPEYASSISELFAEEILPRAGEARNGSDGSATDAGPPPQAGGDWTPNHDQDNSIAELLELGALAPPSRLGALARLGRCDILGFVGSGGMGVVLQVRDSATGDEVAIKLLHPRFVGDSLPATRFLKEARRMAAPFTPAHPQGLRGGGAQRVALLRDALSFPRLPVGPDPRSTHGPGIHPEDRSPGGRCAGPCSRTESDPPRHQARQHPHQ